MPTTYQVTVEPLDPLRFGDSRSARAGLDHFQLDQDPSPVTLHGAVGRFLAGEDGDWPEELLGPCERTILDADPDRVATLCGYAVEDLQGVVWLPKPRHLRLARSGSGRFRPLELLRPSDEPVAADGGTRRRLLLETEPDEKEHEGDVLVDAEALAELLAGELPRDLTHRVRVAGGAADSFYRAEPRPGIAVANATGRVAEGMFFTRPYRRFRPASAGAADGRVADGLRLWLRTPGEVPVEKLAGVGYLGGDRGRARFALRPLAEPPLAELCERVAAAAGESAGFLLYLLTPVIAEGGEPDVAGQRPVAAALGKPLWVSGWNAIAGGVPRELSTLVPAGSVWFFDWPPGADRAGLVRREWLRAVGRRGSAAGYGRALVGVWR